MKKKNLIIPLILSVFFLCTNCMKEPLFHAPEDIKKEFASTFPGATSIEWSSRKGFAVATFRSAENQQTRAWYDAKGSWVMTETIKPSSLDEKLPDRSKKILNNRHNSDQILSAYIVEFDKIEWRYVIEAGSEKNPVFLFFRGGNGELFKIEEGGWENEPIIIPEKIAKEIEHYDVTIKIIDAWKENEILKLRTGEEKQNRLLCYDEDEEWIANYYELTKTVDYQEYERVKKLVNKKFPELSNARLFIVLYPAIDKEDKETKKCLLIKHEQEQIFIDKNGEEVKEIPESVTSMLSQIKIDH